MTTKKRPGAEGGAKRGVRKGATGGVPVEAAAPAVTNGDAPTDLYSLRQLAAQLKVDRHRLAEKVRDVESFPGPNRSRLYSLGVVEEALAADADPELAEARRRKMLAEAELAELRLGRERGELESRQEVIGRLILMLRAFRIRLTQTWPRQIAAQLHKAETPDQVVDLLRREAERMLVEFRLDQLRFIRETEGMEGVFSDEGA